MDCPSYFPADLLITQESGSLQVRCKPLRRDPRHRVIGVVDAAPPAVGDALLLCARSVGGGRSVSGHRKYQR